MPSAFVSYAHEDQEFVLSLVEHLRGQGLDITYDQIVLEIGDSLIRRIAEAILEGDFLIAVISPYSVDSEWCQKELAIAETQGINEKRVKVLPVRFQGAEMPPMLHDTVWADADRDDIETVTRRLARAITAHIEGREGDAERDAEQVVDAGGVPAHAERPGDADVALIDAVTERALTVLEAWVGVWNRLPLGHRPRRRDSEDRRDDQQNGVGVGQRRLAERGGRGEGDEWPQRRHEPSVA